MSRCHSHDRARPTGRRGGKRKRPAATASARVGEPGRTAGRTSRGTRVMRNRWIITGLLVAAGLLAGPAALARAEPTGWDVSADGDLAVWAPVGTDQHDG